MAYSIRISPFTVQVHRPGSLKKREHAMSNIHFFTYKNGSEWFRIVQNCPEHSNCTALIHRKKRTCHELHPFFSGHLDIIKTRGIPYYSLYNWNSMFTIIRKKTRRTCKFLFGFVWFFTVIALYNCKELQVHNLVCML